MSCEHLICANCAGPVADGGCPTCRAARRDRHDHGMRVSPQVALVLAAFLTMVLILALRFFS
jgi:hypothetical protein